tara:strand:+ start:31 stop:1428 length:1398 start_codon:yes stop_codon:yes gene_type:complete
MAFKMKGFNPGKGTGMSNGFSRVTLNPATRDDPEGILIGNPEGMGGATVDNETREDIKKKKKDSETNEMMFEDLTNRLEEYKNDPLKVEVGPMEAYYPTDKETGAKLSPPKGMFKDWMRRNAEALSDMPGVRVELDKNGRIVKATGPLQAIYNKKINEAINIDNDLKMSAEQGYGFNEEQLQDFGIYGMDEFGFNPNIQGGGDYVTTQGLDAYAPDPTRSINIKRNQANLDEVKRQERVEQRFNFHKNALDRAIRQGRMPGPSTIKAMKETDPEYYASVVEPYLNMSNRERKKFDKVRHKDNITMDKGRGVQLLESYLNPPQLKDTKDPVRPGEGMLVDATDKKDDAILADMDKMIAEQEQAPVKEETPVKEEIVEEPTVEEPTVEAEQSFDPRDTNKDGVVDRKEKRAAMFADAANPQSAMTKAILMNADSNPFKFGSKEHEQYINNRSRAQGLAIKQRYNKFL